MWRIGNYRPHPVIPSGVMTVRINQEKHLSLARGLALLRLGRDHGFVTTQTPHCGLASCMHAALRLIHDGDSSQLNKGWHLLVKDVIAQASEFYWADDEENSDEGRPDIYAFVADRARSRYHELDEAEFTRKVEEILVLDTMTTAPDGMIPYNSLYNRVDCAHPDSAAQEFMKAAFEVHVRLLTEKLEALG